MAAPKVTLRPGEMVYQPQFDGDEGLVMWFPEAAGQTFVAGDVLCITASGAGAGQVFIPAASPIADAMVVGLAESNANGTTNHLVRVRVFRPGDIFLMNNTAATTFTYGTTNIVAGYDLTWVAGVGPTVGASGGHSKVQVIGTPELSPADTVITPFVGTGGDVVAAPTAAGPVYVKIMQDTTHIWYAN